jgi:hypothetical protein
MAPSVSGDSLSDAMDENLMNLRGRWISRRGAYGALGVLIVVVVFFSLPISLSRSVDVAGKILPVREWLLVKNQEGGVLATYNDYLHGSVDTYAAVTIIRGDAFRFALYSSLKPGDPVSAGDTVVSIHSHELAREAQRLYAEIAVAKATLAMVISGEKEPITQEAERALVLAKERLVLQTLLFSRQDSLYQKNLTSRELYDLARSAAQVSAIEVAIAEARLQTVATGAKPEQVRMIESQIAGLERQTRALSEQVDALTLVSPFTGVLLSSPGTDTLCTIEDTTRVVLIPVPVEYLSRVAPGQSVTLRVPPHRERHVGTLVRVDQRVRIVVGRQVVMATATLNGTTMALPSNLVVVGSIETDQVPPARYLLYWISDLVTEVIGAATGI